MSQKGEEKYSTKSELPDFASMIQKEIANTLDKDTWIVDTGASRHICSFPSLVDNSVVMRNPVNVHLPNGTSVQVTHSGNIKLSNEITLTEVLIVPTFKYNMLSIGPLLEGNKLECIFTRDWCWLRDPKVGVIKKWKGIRVGLYVFKMMNSLAIAGAMMLRIL
ncbi:hypothetical protein DH2020_018617 [Rehmannia glutinosa]|uniref:Retrovirus-related Pol polyprotein from transposon TNT 1-94-like beta-barrel domain-containing protein n=1 Tax=Rehmannia glutinosa TaxID=99300 RepID=A0ABR0WNX6_REHGL